jgi:prepilin-type processing-associated H-X9-DG protein
MVYSADHYLLNIYDGQRDAQPRHSGRVNVGFCDGHVETVSARKLSEKTPEAWSRWNKDHQPHL